MVKLYLCFLVITSRCLLAFAGSAKVLDGYFEWSKAREACQNSQTLGSCDLITKKTLNQEWSKLELSGTDRYWVGGRRLPQWLWDKGDQTNLPLFEDHGCYKLEVEVSSRLRKLTNSGAQECYVTCSRTGYLYLQGSSCYCPGDSLKGVQVSSDKCDLLCNGSNHRCGAKEQYFSVYSIPSLVEFAEVDKAVECAVGDIRGNTPYIFTTVVSCTSSQQYFCLSDLNAETVEKREEPFDTAVSRCAGRHDSSLPTLGAFDQAQQLVTNYSRLVGKVPKEPNEEISFWLPLRKHVNAVWVNGETGESGGELGTCLAATPRTASYRVVDVDCSRENKAICYCSDKAIGGEGDGDDSSEAAELKTVLIIVVLVTVFVVVLVVSVFIFIRRRRHSHVRSELEHAAWSAGQNPVFRG